MTKSGEAAVTAQTKSKISSQQDKANNESEKVASSSRPKPKQAKQAKVDLAVADPDIKDEPPEVPSSKKTRTMAKTKKKEAGDASKSEQQSSEVAPDEKAAATTKPEDMASKNTSTITATSKGEKAQKITPKPAKSQGNPAQANKSLTKTNTNAQSEAADTNVDAQPA